MFLRKLTLILPMAAVAGCTDGGPLPAVGADPQATPTTVQSTSALSSGLSLRGVPAAHPRAPGLASPNVLSPELIDTPVAQGSNRLENPTTGAITATESGTRRQTSSSWSPGCSSIAGETAAWWPGLSARRR